MPELKNNLFLKTRSWDNAPLHFCFFKEMCGYHLHLVLVFKGSRTGLRAQPWLPTFPQEHYCSPLLSFFTTFKLCQFGSLSLYFSSLLYHFRHRHYVPSRAMHSVPDPFGLFSIHYKVHSRVTSLMWSYVKLTFQISANGCHSEPDIYLSHFSFLSYHIVRDCIFSQEKSWLIYIPF